MADRSGPIGVLDSGVGGISTLGAMTRLLPGETFLYYGDTRNAPYGTKSTEEVIALVRRVAEYLEDEGAKALVLACNTASGAAAATLRQEKSMPVIAMEPALKPAYEAAHRGKILVMATPLTLRQEKFIRLMEKYGENAVPLPCDGLMELVERENMAGAEAYLERLFSSWDMGTVAAVVLGCTHYVFLKPMIREMLPADIILTEGNEGTARQLKRVLEQRELLNPAEKGRVIFHTSGDAETVIPVMERLYERAKKL